LSFGGGGSGQIKYTITVEDAQAASKIKGIGDQFKTLGQTTQSTSQQLQAVPETFQTIVQEGNKVTTTTKQMQQTMQGTVTTVTTATKSQQSFGEVLKNNVLSITVAASSIIGLVSQYTSLRRAQITAEKAALAEQTTMNKVTDLRRKLGETIIKYGQNSTQAAKGARDLAVAEEKASIAAQRNEVIQASLSEKTADFAVNILPNLIGSVGSVIQVLQGFRKVEEVSTVTTIENTGAQIANATAMKLSGTATKGMVGPLKAVSAAEIGAGTAAKGMGMSIKGALIGTGIGAIIVAIGTALVAFTQNWWGVRDAVNAAGVELGKMFPILTPLLNGMKELGNWIIKIFGGEVPDSTATATEGMAEFGDATDDTAQEAIKAAEEIASAWKKTVDDLIVLPGSVHKEWKEQFQKLRKLGFTKGGIHELKDQFFRPAGIAKSITDSISEALQIVGKTKISGKSMKGLANNMIDSINEGIKKAKGQLDFMSTLVDLIKANKKNVNLPKLVAEWFNGLPAALKTKLKDFGIDSNEIVKTLGFDPAKIKAAVTGVFSQAFQGIKTEIQSGTVSALGNVQLGGMIQGQVEQIFGVNKKQGWLADIIESIKTAFSPANLESVRQQLIAGLLAAPGNVSSLIRKFIDPVLAQILDTMVTFGTVMIPQWISSTFTWSNFSSALGTLKNLGTQFVTALWAILADPKESANQINTFVTNTVDAIGAWFAQTFPKLSATFDSIFANAVTWFKGLLDAAIEVGKSIPSTIAAWMGEIPKAIAAVFNNAVSWFKGLVDAAITVAKSIPSTIAAWISQKASEVASAALNVGNQIGAKIKEGVLAGLNAEANWLASWFKLPEATGATGAGHRPLTGQDLAGLTPKPGSGTPAIPTTSSTQTLQLDNRAAIKAVDVVAKRIQSLSSIQAMINLINSQAIKLVDAIAKRIDSLTGLKPQISLENNQAIKSVDVIAKRIDSLEKIKPQISLQNKQAIKATDVVAKRIDSLEKIKPQINLQNKQAIKAVDAVAKRINSLSGIDAKVNVHVGVTGPGVKFLAEGMHGVVTKPTLFMAGEAGPERIDVSPTSGQGQGLTLDRNIKVKPTGTVRRDSGGGIERGDIVVNNLIDLGSDKIIRSFKRRLGSERYTFGA
jgi:hypothetical protein